MKRCFLFLFTFTFALFHATAQKNNSWNGKKAAVVLTYDDGLNVHLTNVIPSLDSFKLKGTFYISDFNGLNAQIPGWKKAAANGHELANHTIWHACEGGRAGREFVKPDYDFRFYTVRRVVDEIRGMNNILKAIDGKDKRTFAYPCGDTKIGDTAYIDPLRKDFIAARTVKSEMPTMGNADLYYLPCYMMNGHTGEQMIELVKQAMQKNALLVFLFHGVGGEHGLNVELPEHRKLLQFLQQQKTSIWVPTVAELADYITKSRNKE